MSEDLKERAVTLWTRLVEAMRADGLLATCVTSSGPATTNLLLEVAALPPAPQGPWLPMTMMPTPGREVIAISKNGGFSVLFYDGKVWRRAREKTKATASYYTRWCFVTAPETE